MAYVHMNSGWNELAVSSLSPSSPGRHKERFRSFPKKLTLFGVFIRYAFKELEAAAIPPI